MSLHDGSRLERCWDFREEINICSCLCLSLTASYHTAWHTHSCCPWVRQDTSVISCSTSNGNGLFSDGRPTTPMKLLALLIHIQVSCSTNRPDLNTAPLRRIDDLKVNLDEFYVLSIHHSHTSIISVLSFLFLLYEGVSKIIRTESITK
jgi:hypothetical protein